MPGPSADKVFQYLDQAEFMVPADEARMEHLAVIHALRSAADGMKRLGEQQDRHGAKLDELVTGMHSVDKRLAIIEANSLSTTVAEIDERVTALEATDHRRQGAIGLWDFVLKSWPAIVGFVLLVAAILVS